MKITIEKNWKTEKKKAYRVVIKANNPQVGKIVFYTDDLNLNQLFTQSESLVQRHEDGFKDDDTLI